MGETAGSLICSYPWSAVETPNKVFEDGDFQFEFANFLSLPETVNSGFPRPPAHSQYRTALLTGIMRSVGLTADVARITKLVRDNVGQWPRNDRTTRGSWRRSSLWLLIRVAIQMSLDRSPLGCASYKQFMLFFICTLASDAMNADLSNALLHLVSSKIIRRLSKLGSSATSRLSEMALKTCAGLREILQARWDQANVRPFSFRNPSQDELARSTQLLLSNSCEYIRDALTNDVHVSIGVSFTPEYRRRGTIKDFLSSDGSFFEKAYDANPGVTAFDVRKSVEQGIDDWLACVTDVDDACTQLGTFMDKYIRVAGRGSDPEVISVNILTGIDLFIALDKLAVREIPMLADYSPEIPITFLEKLLLRKTTDLHRLSCAYQYLSTRWSRSRPGWSALSNEFTEDSFPVRYYDQPLPLQQLKARIEANAMQKVSGWTNLQVEGADTFGEYQGHRLRHSEQELVEFTKSPLPTFPLHAKVVVFELQCPPCIRFWRSAVPCALHYFSDVHYGPPISEQQHNQLADDPALRSYFVECQGPPLRTKVHFAYCPEASRSRNSPTLCYVVRRPALPTGNFLLSSVWKSRGCYENEDLQGLGCWDVRLPEYLKYTSNDILARQLDCPTDLTLNEFITFAHLRSGGSLQWLNILRGLRSGTLNLRRHRVHFNLANAVFQVGPLDLNTGAWIWHQELQDASFCNALLDELDSLLAEVGERSVDAILMTVISLLLTRVLASSPSEGVSEVTIALLRRVRKKTFRWMQDLSYDLGRTPTNEERRTLLLDMATACRSTFNVDGAILPKLVISAEDVDALLSCAFFVAAHCGFSSQMSIMLDTHLAPTAQTRHVIIQMRSCNETFVSLQLSRRL